MVISKKTQHRNVIKTALENMLDSEDQPPSEINVLLTGSAEIRALNQTFRNIDSPTDVLSFPDGQGPEPSRYKTLGDIAISLEIATLQANAHGTSVETELAALAVHGGLHLLGYEDDTEEGRESMINKMNAVLLDIGLSPAQNWSSVEN